MNTSRHSLLLIASLALAVPFSRAQTTFLADAQTDPTSELRLFLDAGESTPAPLGSTLWFVADLSGNGVPSGQVTLSQIQDIANGTGDDRLFKTGSVDGSLLGSQPGKYRETGISVPLSYATASIGLFLWNDVNQSNVAGDAGDTFGLYSFGVVPPPQIGNAQYLIGGNVHADGNLVVSAVPEPSEAAMFFGVACLAGAFARRILRRRRTV